MVNVKEAEKILDNVIKLRDKCKKSNDKKLHAQYRQELNYCIIKFDYLVKNKLYKYKQFSNYDDLLQDGRMALMLAVKTYEPSKGNWFWWANQYVKTRIARSANCHSTIKIPLKKSNIMPPFKVLESPETFLADEEICDNAIDNNDLKDVVRRSIARLPSEQRKLIEMYYLFERHGRFSSVTKICKELSISRKKCTNMLNQAKQFLREELEFYND